MAEYDLPNIYPNLNDQQSRLNKLSKCQDYFISEIRKRELMSKKLCKYIVFFIALINL